MKHIGYTYHRFLQLTAMLAVCLLSVATFGQSPAKAKPDVQTIKSASKLMKREMPYQVIVPKDYATNKDARYPVVYFLHGMYGRYDAYTRVSQSLQYFAKRDFIFVFPEGGNGYYSDSATVENDKYESYLIKELIPEIDKDFRTFARREHRVIAGGSMGGYGALKFGLKYPEKFTLIGSFAGAFGAAEVTEKTYPGRTGKILDTVFGPMGSESRKANGIRRILNNLTPEQVKALPMIYQSCGTEDRLFVPNRTVLALINKKKILHQYRELPGKHNGAFFFPEIGEFIAVTERHLFAQIAEIVSKTAKEKGGAAAVAEYRKLRSKYVGKYSFFEDQLNQLGYDLLGMDKIKDAIEILKLNVEMYPKSSNPYDSLGEAYLKAGNKKLALVNYEKSVELDPENTSGIKAIKKLEGKETKGVKNER